ncbi:GNAT family N-acetyltransferase [Streptomyces sp. ACA25]|uniref:GNAT family N-acetyltransferase n=1 Tax=Streptomyces sp. ACA25 TaxID=3022596 RepID=UPI002306EC2E|nr:GNAT family N-acetyltransferase [Streptomyces sp. ACA25]MDB1086742.1 GNAT family N-acetyltransferase [Streptomyces sp. ACA25]
MTTGVGHALPGQVQLFGEGIALRDWDESDLPAMVELFDDPEIGRWTPLPLPFDAEAARDHLVRGRDGRSANRFLQLAVVTEAGEPCGEALVVWEGEDRREAELGYCIGARFRRRGLASRALRVLTGHAHREWGVQRALLRIEPENAGSVAVARAAGYRLTEDPPVHREIKGRLSALRTWRYDG